MSERSFRSRIVAGSLLWTVGLLMIQFAVASLIVSTHPRWIPHVHYTMLIVGAIIVMAAGFFQWRMGLSPMSRLRRRLGAVKGGESPRVDGSYPAEIQALVTDLNALLDERDARVRRAQTQAGDLAHALKTPLAVLSSEAAAAEAAGQQDVAAAIRQQVERMRRQMDWHLARARAAVSGASPTVRASVRDAAEGLSRALHKIHGARALAIDIDVSADIAVRVERQDLDELLGNLMDNACKFARGRVRVAAASTADAVSITVDDDGAGLSEMLRDAVLQRGVRADMSVPGSGFGLAIVRELAEIYGGALRLAASPLGGLRAELTLPGK